MVGRQGLRPLQLPSRQQYAINHTAASLVLFVRGQKEGK